MSTFPLRTKTLLNRSSRLPIELLNAVVSFVHGKGELYQLCRASKLLRSMAEQRLYLLHFRHSELAKANIRELLQHPRFETLINSVSIVLRRSPRLCGVRWPPGVPCSCDETDQKLGAALNNLLGLRFLWLECWICEVESQGRHRWLLTLKTRSLQELKFRCCCSPTDANVERAIELFETPCMASVINLSYRVAYPFPSSGRTEIPSSYSLDMALLPKLRHLQHAGQNIHNLLLHHHHNITRLSASLATLSMIDYKELWKFHTKLTHMSLRFNEDGYEEFFNSVIDDPTPFRNLQHIGTIPLVSLTCLVGHRVFQLLFELTRFKERCKELCLMLSQLTSLERLVSFDAEFRSELCTSCHEYDTIFQKGLSQLLESFPRLCRAFLETTFLRTDIWVLSRKWECRARGCKLDKFDLINDSELPPWEVELHRQG
jgi:hypothetical protein